MHAKPYIALCSVQVVVLDYDPDGETFKLAERHSHPAEIWQLASCPAGDPRMLLSVYSEGALPASHSCGIKLSFRISIASPA